MTSNRFSPRLELLTHYLKRPVGRAELGYEPNRKVIMWKTDERYQGKRFEGVIAQGSTVVTLFRLSCIRGVLIPHAEARDSYSIG